MKNYFLTIIMVLCAWMTKSNAQNLLSEWGYAITGNGFDESIGIEIGSDGSIYNTGKFQYNIDVDPTDTNSTDLISAGSFDIFIQKISANGDMEWTKRIGNHHYESINGITLDSSDNVYITGAFLGTVDFDPGPGTYNLSTLSNTSGTNIFILKLDSDGNFVWAKNIGSTHNDFGHAITADSQNNIYVTGRFQYTVDFDPGPAEYNQTTSYYGSTFVLKLNQDGDFIWVKSFQQTANSNNRNAAYNITIDNDGNVITAGMFKGTIDFDPSSNVYNITGAYSSSIFNTNMFIQKMTSNGDFLWAKHLSGINYKNAINALAVNSDNDILIAGNYSGSVDFDPSPTVTNSIIGNKDAFVLSLNQNGAFKWVNTFVSTYYYVVTNGISVDPYDNIYTTGYFENTANFNTNSTTPYNLTSVSSNDIFIHKLNKYGVFNSCDRLGAIGNDRGNDIALDQNDNVIVSGAFQSPFDIDLSPSTDTLFSNGLTLDAFLIKYSQCEQYYIDTQIVCDSLLWIDGEIYTSNNSTATDTLTTVNGCDSIIYLNLTVLDNGVTIDTQQACGSFTWINGITYTESIDSVFHTLTNQQGCDSILELNLFINHIDTTNVTISICNNNQYTVGNSTYTVSGNYSDTLSNVMGCDSIINLELTVNPLYNINLTENICHNDNYMVGNSTYNSTGNYSDTLTSIFGCDSIVHLNLLVNPIHTTNITESICQNDHYMVGSSNYNSTGSYSDTLSNVYGCDSIVNLNLTVNPIHNNTLTEVICEGDFYIVGNSQYTVAGNYSDTLANTYGCDSIVNLNLTVNPTHNNTLTEIICEGDHYMVGSSNYNSAGSYSDTLSNVYGCDSVINLNLTVNPIHNNTLTEVICEGDFYIVGNSQYTVTGNYSDTLANIYDCDSIVNLNLTVNPVNTTNLNENICENDTYLVGNSSYNTAGIYSDTLNNIYGCDSIVNLNLTVNSVNTTNLNEVICENDHYIIGNSYYTVAGNYSDTLANMYGCDSIVNLNLTVNPVNTTNINESICENDTYLVGNSSYNSTGNYSDTLSNVYGCDSIINLNLTVNTHNVTNLSEDICLNEEFIVGSSSYNTDGNYSDTLTNINGCDSIVNLELTIISIDESISINGFELRSNQDNASYQWLTCPDYQPIDNATQQNYNPTDNGEYSLEITFKGCVDTISCVNISGIDIKNYNTSDISVYPNPFKNKIVIEYQNKEEVLSVVVHNINGKRIFQTQDIDLATHISTSLWHSGSYIVTIRFRDGNSKNLLMLKHD